MVWQSIKKFSLPWQTVGLHWLFPPSCLLVKHFHVLPSIMGILLAWCCSSLFWGDFLPALLYHGVAPRHPQLGTPRLLQRWQRNTNFTAALTYTVTAVYHKCTGSLLPTSILAETDWWGSPMQSPAFTPACLSIATVVGSEQADLDSVGNVKVAHPSFILLPVDGMDIPCYLDQLSTSALLLSKQHSRDQHF